MFKKVLVVEDIDSISTGVKTWIQELMPNADVRTTKYCDEAVLKIKRAIMEEAPFDLLISDLSFKTDHQNTKYTTGEELIMQARQLLPRLKVIVYSIDDKAHRIHSLIEYLNVNAFVAKGRHSCNELTKAIEHVKEGITYISPEIRFLLQSISGDDLDDDDVTILRYLSQGYTQADISRFLKENGHATNSISSIEKKLNRLKTSLKATNTLHLVVLAKDLGII